MATKQQQAKMKGIAEHKGEKVLMHNHRVSKPFIIASVAIIAIVGVVLLMFFADTFVGKAIEFGIEGEAGVIGSFLGDVGEPLLMSVTANLGDKKSVAGSFTLTFDPILDVECESVSEKMQEQFMVGGNDLLTINEVECLPGIIDFSFSGLCADDECSNALTGEELVALVEFNPQDFAGTYDINVDSFTVLELDNEENNVATSLIDGKIKWAVIGEDSDEDPTQLTCIDSDGTDYYTPGNVAQINKVTGYEKHIKDACVDNTLYERFCNNGLVETIEFTCEGGCVDGRCTQGHDLGAPSHEGEQDGVDTIRIEDGGVTIEVLKNGAQVPLSHSLTRGIDYTIKVTLLPFQDLGDHLILAKVEYGGLLETQFADSRGPVVLGESEVVQFTHTVPQDPTGSMKVSVFVWNNWLTNDPGAVWESLMDQAEVEYEIQ